MTGRSDPRPMTIMVGIAILFAAAVYAWTLGLAPLGVPTAAPAAPTASATATPSKRAPEVKIDHQTCCQQAARFLDATWSSSEKVTFASFSLQPAPPFDCTATVDPSGRKGRFGCVGLLPGATDWTGKLMLTTATGTFPVEHAFRTMGDRLNDVKWFTEFEDGAADPLACAAASVRIVQSYTTGQDKMTATQILALGHKLGRSADPGLDPVGIAAVLRELDPRNTYHYYRYATREEATAASVYWLMRSGKPVIAITLAGQHAPLVTGFQGAYGTYYDDPNSKITGIVVEDPQRGDLRPETASHRPDKPRAADYQTGHLLGLNEWYRDEWWLGFPYASRITYAGSTYEIDRNDGAYPTPHWAGKYVLIVDDGDGDWPSDKEGRVKYH